MHLGKASKQSKPACPAVRPQGAHCAVGELASRRAALEAALGSRVAAQAKSSSFGLANYGGVFYSQGKGGLWRHDDENHTCTPSG